MRRLSPRFFQRPASAVAPDLIGAVLVCTTGACARRARIVETEAYVGPADLACHAHRGNTPSTAVLFGPPGRAYVYLIYGVHLMLNFVTWRAGAGHAVLVRAAEPLDGWDADLAGPGKLTVAMGVRRVDNGLGLQGERLHLLKRSRVPNIVLSKRIGINCDEEWKGALLRYLDADSRAVSRRA